MRKKFVAEAELRRLTVRAARSGRQIHADDGELGEVRLEVATFDVELTASEALDEARRHLRIQGDAAVAFALGWMKSGVRATRRSQRARNVVVRCLDLLQAHDVPRLGPAQPAPETAPLRRAQPVSGGPNDPTGR